MNQELTEQKIQFIGKDESIFPGFLCDYSAENVEIINSVVVGIPDSGGLLAKAVDGDIV